MDPLTAAAASGMRSRMETLDLLANNLANTSVTGFKTDREFYNLYRAAEAGSDSETLPVIQSNWTDFSQGTLTSTGNALDVALDGEGFLVADATSGPTYTRAGSLKLSQSGQLQTQEGYPIRGHDGKPIYLDVTQPIEITSDGTILQAGTNAGQIAIVNFADNRNLSKRGSTYFTSNAATIPSSATFEQGKLEGSNAQTAESASRLVSVMRQFESLQRALTIGIEMNKEAAQEVARVN